VETKNGRPVAFITGASSGFGMLASVALAKAGYEVAASMRDPASQGRLREAAMQAGVQDRIEVVRLDVTETDTVESVVKDVWQRFGRIDLLVNNAGFAVGGFVEDVALEEWRRQFETNFFGLVAVTKAWMPYMRQQRKGMIMNISSISGRIAFPAMGPYVASKHAVEGFTETLRLEMLPYGVRVVLIEPGSYKTEIWGKGLQSTVHAEASAYPESMETIRRMVRRIGETAADPKEVIDTIVRVAQSPSPKLRYPIGKGATSGILLKQLLPWKLLERIIHKNISKKKG
jgi:NAD(P)-dependent dehydrogenase (short-subunit alcohol dehydrogenase family)